MIKEENVEKLKSILENDSDVEMIDFIVKQINEFPSMTTKMRASLSAYNKELVEAFGNMLIKLAKGDPKVTGESIERGSLYILAECIDATLIQIILRLITDEDDK